ncbi:MAG: hypothetical protein KJ043_01785 [Anaerolineae bacterium]|nr:hypothetical protein [Anaerolineae bacterium]
MKRVIVSLLMVFVLAFSLSITQAKPAQVTLANAFFADQMPAGAGVYATIRTDDAYIDELDGILSKITTYLTSMNIPTQPNLGVRQMLDMAVMSAMGEGDFATTIRPWLGASVAMAVYWGENSAAEIFIAIDHNNRELAEAFIENVTSRMSLETSVDGAFTIYTGNNGMLNIGVNNDAIYLASERDYLPINGNPANPLSSDPNFQKAVGALPAPNYNILLVGDTSLLIQVLDNNRSSTRDLVRGLLPDAYTAMGATIVNGTSPTLDIAQVGLPSEIVSLINTPIDPIFAQNIPANATGVIHGTNLIAPYNALIDLVSAQTGQDLRAQLNQAQSIFGFDVIELLFSGDFGAYFTYKPEGIVTMMNQQLQALETNPYGFTTLNVENVLDMGIIFEISNPEQSQLLIDQLTNLYGMLGANTGVTLTREEIAGGNALILTLSSSNMENLDVIVGTNDTLFVIGTRQSATAILNGEGGFDSNPFHQNSLRYTLPTMTHYWFLDRNIVTAAGGVLAILSPQIGMVFTSINNTLATPNATEAALQEERLREQNRQSILSAIAFNESMQVVAQLFDNASVSVSSKEGILFVRAVITLSE